MGCLLDGAGPVEAVIFDMDGLLVDTERLALRGIAAAGDAMGVDVPQAFRHSLIGVPADQCRRLAAAHYGPDFPIEEFFESAGREFAGLIEAGELQLKPGVSELLACLEQRHVPIAVATSSGRTKALDHLRMVGILDRFDAVVTRDDVERGKPHPDLYLRAAERLATSPARCLALEDSYNGVRAAAAAGVRVIMVPDVLAPTDEMRATCEAVAADLHEVRALL